MCHFNEPDLASFPPTRRRWKWLILGGLVLLLVLVIGGVYTFFRVSAEWSWQAAVAEAEQDDPNWRWKDLQASWRTYADDENGALVVLAARRLLPQRWPAWEVPLPAPGSSPAGAAPAAEDAYQQWTRQEAERKALADSFHELEPPFQFNKRQLNALREELKKAEQALAEARKLVKFSGGRFPIKYSSDWLSTLMPEIQEARAVTNLLGYDVLLRAQEQDLAGALASCHALLNLCRCFDEEPTLIAMLVRIACRSVAIRRLERVLAQGEPETADLGRLQKVLQEEEAVPVLLHAFRGERAGTDLLTQSLESGQLGVAQVQNMVAGGTPLDTLPLLLPGGLRYQRTAVLRLHNRMVAVAKLPPEQQRAAAAQLEKDIPNMPVLARLLGPAQLKVTEAATRCLAELRCAIAMLAAERYRRTHQRWPESLSALVPEFLPQVPVDPFDGQPLRLRRLKDGLVIYSVSHDGQDNQGKLSIRQEKGTDRGIRLWDAGQRRQPP